MFFNIFSNLYELIMQSYVVAVILHFSLYFLSLCDHERTWKIKLFHWSFLQILLYFLHFYSYSYYFYPILSLIRFLSNTILHDSLSKFNPSISFQLCLALLEKLLTLHYISHTCKNTQDLNCTTHSLCITLTYILFLFV